MKNQKTDIGIGHLVRAMQITGFGHEEIMAMRSALLSGNFSGIQFVHDCYSKDWDDCKEVHGE